MRFSSPQLHGLLKSPANYDFVTVSKSKIFKVFKVL